MVVGIGWRAGEAWDWELLLLVSIVIDSVYVVWGECHIRLDIDGKVEDLG